MAHPGGLSGAGELVAQRLGGDALALGGEQEPHPLAGARVGQRLAGGAGRGEPVEEDDNRSAHQGRMPDLLAAAVAGVLPAQFMEVAGVPAEGARSPRSSGHLC
jgi:hypothetical protein